MNTCCTVEVAAKGSLMAHVIRQSKPSRQAGIEAEAMQFDKVDKMGREQIVRRRRVIFIQGASSQPAWHCQAHTQPGRQAG